jgi:dTMP kinase
MVPADREQGLFIVIDGVDGCGKSTQARRLVAALEAERGLAPVHLREPGSTPAGERIREVLLSREHDLDPGVEALLLAAARRHMLAERVAPALTEGRDVVCERFHPSTFAYQAVAGGLDEEAVLELLGTWADQPHPDLVIVIDTGPETAAGRIQGPGDRIEDKGLEFQRRVASGYRRYAERVAGTVVVDGERGEEEVAADILAEVRRAG